LDDPLCRVLAIAADLVPQLLIPKMTGGYWAARYFYVSAAARSGSASFIPTIVGLLTDRSIYIKTLVLELIVAWPHLRVAAVLPKLEKLAKMKSFARPDMDRHLLEKARRCVQVAVGSK
jgi:hypothetical protein